MAAFPGLAVQAAGGDAPGALVTEIQVSGEAQIALNPDMATVTLAVESQAETAPEAQEENARRINAVRAALEELGIEREAISTANFRLNPVWEEASSPSRAGSSGSMVITGYRVSHDLLVKLDDINRVGEVVDAAVGAGADRVSYIEFGVKDAGRYRADLLEEAFRDARAKAEALTRAAGLVLVGPTYISEGGYTPFPSRPMARMAFDMAAATEIMPGEQQVSVRVEVAFRAVPPEMP